MIKEKVCTFTGHRELIYGDLNIELLDKKIEELIKDGYTKFNCGMAKGFDLIAARRVLQFKKNYDIKLAAYIPCGGQEKSYTEEEKAEYYYILDNCDEVIVLSPVFYRGCMNVRDRQMVEHCDCVLSYLRTNKGGTYYTVKEAQKRNLNIIEI